MPRFAQDDMDTHSIGGSTFQFSAKKIESLGATEYTLAVLVIDRSGSTDGFEEDIDAADEFQLHFHEAGHGFTPESRELAYDWLVEKLKP